MNVHRFESNEEAYDASQCDEAIKDGDLLVTPDAIAVLMQAWPVLLYGDTMGVFHKLADGVTWADVKRAGDGDYQPSVDAAQRLVGER